jgi:hypothetical protein
MRKSLWALVIISGLAVTAPQAYADGWYYGGKLVYFEVDVAGIDDPDNAGIVVGHEWDVKYGAIGVEGEYTTTFEDGKLGAQDIDFDTAGIYAVYKTHEPGIQGIGPYLKLKAGAAYNDLTVGTLSEDDTNFAAGIGLGLNMATVAFELEFTVIDDDIDMISFFVRF